MKKFILSSISILALSLVFTACSTNGGNAQDTEPNITTENISINSSDTSYKIESIYTYPNIDDKFPLVVMLHGTGSNKDEAGNAYADYSKDLAKSGIASLRFDFIGTGDSTVPYENYNFKTAVDDANTVISYASTLSGVDTDNIGILGWSQGGTIAMLTASQNHNIKSITTWAGAPDMSISITDEDYKLAQKQGYAVKSFDWRDDLNFGIDWYNDVKSTDVLAELSKSSTPILAINGSLDTVVSPDNAQKIVDASSSSHKEALILDGADHTFNVFSDDKTIFNELCSATTEWFKSTLK